MGVDGLQQLVQLGELGAVLAQGAVDMVGEHLLHPHGLLDQLRALLVQPVALLVQRLAAAAQFLDAVGLLVVAHGADIGGDQQDSIKFSGGAGLDAPTWRRASTRRPPLACIVITDEPERRAVHERAAESVGYHNTAPAAQTSACPHPEAVGTRWGDDISEERQAELRAFADRQRVWAAQPEATRRQCIRGRGADGRRHVLVGQPGAQRE
jgi:hypothetical protein